MTIFRALKDEKNQWHIRLLPFCLILLTLAAFCTSRLSAQTPTPVQIGTSSDANSPSITSFTRFSTSNLVMAFVSGGVINISTSTNDGATWSTPIALPTPNSNFDAMDDPQILADQAGSDVSLVARAYLTSSAQGEGQTIATYDANSGSCASQPPDPNGHKDIYTYVGIYYAHSTDGGSTWTTNGGSIWQPVATQLGSTTLQQGGGPFYTLDHPRITSRHDYGDWVNDMPGCIVWEQREFSSVSWDGARNVFNQPSSDITTHIGIAFYNDGTLYKSTTGSYYLMGTTTESNPQRPSVAISPDGGIWLAYYVCASQDEWNNAEADYYVQKGSVTFSGSPAKTTVTFSSTTADEVKASELLPGFYDKYRGYFFSQESQIYPDFDDEFAQGPSIQVAINNIYQCEPTYTVGFAYTRGDVTLNSYCDGSNTDVSRWLTFWYAQVPFGGTAAAVTWSERDQLNAQNSGRWQMFLLPTLKYTDDLDNKHFSGSPDGALSTAAPVDARMASHFVLSYIFMDRCHGSDMVGDELDDAYCQTAVSFDNTFDDGIFQNTEQQWSGTNVPVNIEYLGTKIDACGEQANLQVHVAWHHFPVPGNSPTGDQLDENNGGAIIAQAYLDGYPFNDKNAFDNTVLQLPSAVFNAVGDNSSAPNPYHYFNFDGINQPSNISVLSGAQNITTLSGTNGAEGISAGLGAFENEAPDGTNVGQEFVPAISIHSSKVDYGDYWAHYFGTTKKDYGLLNTSDQRKIVITENIAHAVFEERGVVYYSEGMPNNPIGDGSQREWTQPIAIGGIPAPNSGVSQTLPTIAVYEEDGEDAVRTAELALNDPSVGTFPESPDRYDGLSSIAITWTELTSIPGSNPPMATAAIKIRTREFNACTGDWYNWGQTQTVYTGAVGYSMNDPNSDGVTEPYPVSAVAPLAYPPLSGSPLRWIYKPDPSGSNNSGGSYTFLNTNLIGWVTTWTDDYGDDGYGDLNTGGVEIRSRTLLRKYSGSSIVNSNWGQYDVTPDFVPSNMPYNRIYSNPCAWSTKQFLSYLSTTSQENKAEDSIVGKVPNAQQPPGYINQNPRKANYQIDVAFSDEEGQEYDCGGYTENGLGVGSVIYYGSSDLGYGAWDRNALVPFSPPISNTITPSPYAPYIWDTRNNPEVTVNSSGQQFLAWQEMQTSFSYVIPYGMAFEEFGYLIGLTNTDYKGTWNPSNVPTFITYVLPYDFKAPVSPIPGYWLRDPSIAGEPKTMDVNYGDNPPSDPLGLNFSYYDNDFGEVQLMFWEQHGSNPNALRQFYYSEDAINPGFPNSGGNGGWDEALQTPPTGTNPQTSFSTFTMGKGPALMVGNTTANPPDYMFGTPYPNVGAYKLGIFDSTPDYTQYRSETRKADTVAAKFVWGNATITEPGDTVGERIKLELGVDTAGWQSRTETRDSLFRTQRFVFDVGSTVSWFQGGLMMGSDSLAAMTGFPQSDSMLYDVEMVHGNGAIDTLERLTFAPGTGAYISPTTISTQPSLIPNDTVYLRVEGTAIGFSDADSLCFFANEICLDHYASAADSTLAEKRSTPFAAPSKTALEVLNAYPNPITGPGTKTTVLLSCPKGLTVTLELADATGKVLGIPMMKAGTGSWQSFSLPLPNANGDYFIRITDGIDSQVLPISVIR